MGLFRLNTESLHLSIDVQFSNGTVASYGFSPRSSDVPSNYDILLSYIVPNFGYNGLFSLLGLTAGSTLFLAYKHPDAGALASAVFVHHLNGFLRSTDGKGTVEVTPSDANSLNILDYPIRPMSPEAESRFINFIEDKVSNPPSYDIYQYNCASLVQEAFCEVYPSDCDDFKSIVEGQVYESPSFLNLISVTFLNTFNLLN